MKKTEEPSQSLLSQATQPMARSSIKLRSMFITDVRVHVSIFFTKPGLNNYIQFKEIDRNKVPE